MTERTRALLINALVFPGMGQLLVLRRKVAGGTLVALSLLSLLGVCWAFTVQWLALLSGRPADVLSEAPWEFLSALSEVCRAPGRELLLWVVALASFWVAALIDGALFSSRSEGASR